MKKIQAVITCRGEAVTRPLHFVETSFSCLLNSGVTLNWMFPLTLMFTAWASHRLAPTK
jgi:hypothetical protein